MIVDFLFVDILSAPTTESFQSSNNESQTSTIIRRISNILPNPSSKENQISQTPQSQSSSPPIIIKNNKNNFRESLVLNTETRIVSSRFSEIHSLATKSMSGLNTIQPRTTRRITIENKRNESSRKTRISMRSTRKSLINSGEIKDKENKVDEIRVGNNSNLLQLSDSQDNQQNQNKETGKDIENHDNNNNNNKINELEELFECLLLDIEDQRESLKRIHEREIFDSLWG